MQTRRHLRNSLALTVIATAVLSSAAAVAQPAPNASSPLNGRIAFHGCGNTGCDIYTVNPDGTALHQITHDGSSFQPDWSPDATQIAYASGVSGRLAVWIADAEGGNARPLTPDDPTSDSLWPKFTPDGRTIVYTTFICSECGGGISAIDVDGNNQRVITPSGSPSGSYNAAVPSPDGRRLAFMKWHEKGVMMGTYLLRPGQAPEYPVTSPALEGSAPNWSPDGGKLLVSSNISRPNGAIYSIRPDGQNLQQLTYPKFPQDDWLATYSPDGQRIVFVSDRQYPDRCCTDLFTMRADDAHGNVRQGEQFRQIQRIPLPALGPGNPRWGTAPLLSETTMSVTLSQSVRQTHAMSVRDMCRLALLLDRTPLCHK